jgi:hypothetical protein
MNTRVGAIAIFFFSILAILLTIKLFKKDRLSTRLLFFWFAIWFSIGFFALFPQLLDYLKNYLNIGNRVFFLTWSGILILFIVIFFLTSHMTRMSRKMAHMAQEIALLNFKLEEFENKINSDKEKKEDCNGPFDKKK